MRKLTKEQRDKMRRNAKLDMSDAYYLTYRGSMEAILAVLDDLDEADRELAKEYEESAKWYASSVELRAVVDALQKEHGSC